MTKPALAYKIYPRNCIFCKKPFIGRQSNSITCSETCGRKYYYQQHFEAEQESWRRKSEKRYREIQKLREGKSCICCGTTENLELDHIFPAFWRNKHHRADNLFHYLRLQSNYQILCLKCNRSKKNDVYCLVHDKYLGIWNHLRPLDQLEVDPRMNMIVR